MRSTTAAVMSYGQSTDVWFKFQVVTSDAYQNQAAPTTQNDQSSDSFGGK